MGLHPQLYPLRAAAYPTVLALAQQPGTTPEAGAQSMASNGTLPARPGRGMEGLPWLSFARCSGADPAEPGGGRLVQEPRVSGWAPLRPCLALEQSPCYV